MKTSRTDKDRHQLCYHVQNHLNNIQIDRSQSIQTHQLVVQCANEAGENKAEKLAVLYEQWAGAKENWQGSTLVLKAKQSSSTIKRGTRRWMTEAQLRDKYQCPVTAREICELKERDDVLSKTQIKPNPNLPSRKDLQLYLCFDESIEVDEDEDTVVRELVEEAPSKKSKKDRKKEKERGRKAKKNAKKAKRGRNKKRKCSSSDSSRTTSKSSSSSDSSQSTSSKDSSSSCSSVSAKTKKQGKKRSRGKEKKQNRRDDKDDKKPKTDPEKAERERKKQEEKEAKEQEKLEKDRKKKEEKDEKDRLKREEREERQAREKEKNEKRGKGKKVGGVDVFFLRIYTTRLNYNMKL